MTEAERRQAIYRKLSRMERQPSKSAILCVNGQAASPLAAIPTGFPSLDAALGVGGFPRGCITEIFGPDGCGKTTLALRAIAHFQRSGGMAALIDAEHVFDAGYARALGVELERLPVLEPESAEDAIEIGRRLALSGAVDLLVVDSVAALVPRMELETAVGESGPGLHGRVLASGLRKLAAAVSRGQVSLVFLNQTRARPQALFGEEESSSGGISLKLYAAVRVALAPSGGSLVRVRVLKNKVAEPFREADIELLTEGGAAKGP
jgi:recombination protein RecA